MRNLTAIAEVNSAVARPPNSRPIVHRLLLWALLTVCIFGIAYKLLARHDSFELVADSFVPFRTYNSTVYRDKYFWIETAAGKLTLFSRLPAGGPAKVVGEEPLHGRT